MADQERESFAAVCERQAADCANLADQYGIVDEVDYATRYRADAAALRALAALLREAERAYGAVDQFDRSVAYGMLAGHAYEVDLWQCKIHPLLAALACGRKRTDDRNLLADAESSRAQLAAAQALARFVLQSALYHDPDIGPLVDRLVHAATPEVPRG